MAFLLLSAEKYRLQPMARRRRTDFFLLDMDASAFENT
jgi:hypothetical protein